MLSTFSNERFKGTVVHCTVLVQDLRVPLYTVQSCTLYSTVVHCTVLYTVQYRCTLYSPCTRFRGTVVHCTVLYTVQYRCTLYSPCTRCPANYNFLRICTRLISLEDIIVCLFMLVHACSCLYILYHI